MADASGDLGGVRDSAEREDRGVSDQDAGSGEDAQAQDAFIRDEGMDAGAPEDGGLVPGASHRGVPAAPAFSAYVGPVDEVLSGSVGSSVRGVGTAEAPYVISCEGATIRNERENWLELEGEYVILRDCETEGLGIRVRATHAAVINVTTSGGGIHVRGDYVVVRESRVFDYVHPTNDRHGFNVGCGFGHTWFIENESSGNSGDGFQSGHGCDGNRPHDIYIGGLRCVNNRENCIDTKYVERVVFSGIDSEGHSDTGGDGFSSGSDGSGGVIGSDGDSLGVWVIDSVFRDRLGVRVEDGRDATLVGNTFLQADERTSIPLQKHGEDMWVIDNSGTGGAFLGRPQREDNFLIRVDGNGHPGGIHERVNVDETPLGEGELEARFERVFGFELE